MIKEIISRITMKKTSIGFYDYIEDVTVYYWQDYYFDIYLASNRFGSRIKINKL